MNTLARLRISSLRTSTIRIPSRCMATVRGSHMSNNDPAATEEAKKKSMQRSPKLDTSTHFNKDGGWTEEIASASEAAVKADRGHHTKPGEDDLMKLQKESATIMAKKHKSSK
ncbi:hypothetical protein BC832DRAFT_119833 [Gaertneriomyces semiglobifer]|nr:hypothetical protein BC832DRAFT_119833 [Gaertneriomyces semiglobifer]